MFSEKKDLIMNNIINIYEYMLICYKSGYNNMKYYE